MVKIISQLKGSLCNQSVVFKLGPSITAQPKTGKQHIAIVVPTLRTVMESRGQHPANLAKSGAASRR